ncbi:hypothetical protein H7X65_01625 [Candidatus Parcubacteria bacterium]|nr:hypothetical protein [Candidatus Parcubacteria bacterium]
MSTNTLFDISSPDPAVQNLVFEALKNVDILHANAIRLPEIAFDGPSRFFVYGEKHHATLQAVGKVKRSTNSIHLGYGVLSDFFISLEETDAFSEDSPTTRAFRLLKKKILEQIRVVHIHIKAFPGNDTRRMSLSMLRRAVDQKSPNEHWVTFETPDIDAIAKSILQFMGN